MPMRPVRGDYAAGGRSGEENPSGPRGAGSRLLGLLTEEWHPCNVRQYKLLRSATQPMGRDPLRTRLTANPSRRPVTAERPSLMGVTRGSSSAFRRIPHDCLFKMGELS